MIARASGCSEKRSSDSASCTTRSSVACSATTSLTVGRPWVRVPVLSKATTRTPPRLSRWAPPLTSTPLCPARPMPAAIPTGVDMIRAQGAAATSSTTAREAHSAKSPTPRAAGTTASSTPAPSTDGVYQRPKRSMNTCRRPLRSWATSTRWMIFDSVLSSKATATSMVSAPSPLIEPA